LSFYRHKALSILVIKTKRIKIIPFISKNCSSANSSVAHSLFIKKSEECCCSPLQMSILALAFALLTTFVAPYRISSEENRRLNMACE
ncbi:hypothetical protein OESDEN_18068, partial [Oesophagostomum dentatum]